MPRGSCRIDRNRDSRSYHHDHFETLIRISDALNCTLYSVHARVELSQLQMSRMCRDMTQQDSYSPTKMRAAVIEFQCRSLPVRGAGKRPASRTASMNGARLDPRLQSAKTHIMAQALSLECVPPARVASCWLIVGSRYDEEEHYGEIITNTIVCHRRTCNPSSKSWHYVNWCQEIFTEAHRGTRLPSVHPSSCTPVARPLALPSLRFRLVWGGPRVVHFSREARQGERVIKKGRGCAEPGEGGNGTVGSLFAAGDVGESQSDRPEGLMRLITLDIPRYFRLWRWQRKSACAIYLYESIRVRSASRTARARRDDRTLCSVETVRWEWGHDGGLPFTRNAWSSRL